MRVIADRPTRRTVRGQGCIDRELEQQERRLGDTRKRGLIERQPVAAQTIDGSETGRTAIGQGFAQHTQTSQIHLGDQAERFGVDGQRKIFGGLVRGSRERMRYGRIIVGFHHSSLFTPLMWLKNDWIAA